MANPKHANASILDHDYGTLTDDSEEMEQTLEQQQLDDKTPVNSPLKKKVKKRGVKERDENSSSFELAIQSVMLRFDGLDGKLEKIEGRMNNVQETLKKFDVLEDKLNNIEERTEAIQRSTEENKDNIEKLQKQVEHLETENKSLKEMVLEAARYKRRWNLRLMGLPEKDDEKVRDVIVGILTRVIPVSVAELRQEVDTVHRLGTRAPGNTMPRPVIMQFVRRTVRDEVWKKSREANVCKEMRITFKQDFSREDREARQKLWPRVEEARRRSVRAYLREGYAIIDGKKIYP